MAHEERMRAAVTLFLPNEFAYKSGSVPTTGRLGLPLTQSRIVAQGVGPAQNYENSDSMVFRRPSTGALSSLVPEARAWKSTFQGSDLASNRAPDTSNIYV